MLDFLTISTRSTKRGVIEIYPRFIVKKSSDLMIRGGDFYAIWVESRGLWSTEEQDAIQLIDMELDEYYKENKDRFDSSIKILYMWDAENRMIESWHRFCQRDMRDSYHVLDEKLIFSNSETNKRDYSSKRLSYPLEPGIPEAYNRLMATLYTESERHKIEWAIGSIVSGESKKIQKFMVLYGAAGTGKSTVLNIIQQLFEGYYSVFDAKALGSSNNTFALEAFKSNPLVAIQHDGDLSRIEDNTRLNSLVSHEIMTVNEKFKSAYANRFNCFLFMGTNKPVKITDAKSGLIRRLIDVSPSGNKLGVKEYKSTVKQISFELGAIACHCQDVYLADPSKYDDYIPIAMLGASNDFYNYVIDSYFVFKQENGTTLKAAWEMYKMYCDEAKVSYPLPQRIFKEELKNYFDDYKDRFNLEDGSRIRSYYSGFKKDKFEEKPAEDQPTAPKLIELDSSESIFDTECADCFAQYATIKDIPSKQWDSVQTKLSDLDTKKTHYVKLPDNHIVIDFDIPDDAGNKCLEKNLEEAAKWPPTYAELSKSGKGVHLHYIYTGDPAMLGRVYDDHIEVKVFTGKSSLRRRLTKCNTLPIATISSGLPLKEDPKMVNFKVVKNERVLRTQIKKNLNKEFLSSTKCSIDFIYKILSDAYASELKYDVTDMRNAVLAFAAGSTHQADYCIKLVNKMPFKSEDVSAGIQNDSSALIFFDIEIFPNLFIVNWKMAGEGKPIVRLINPTPAEIEALLHFRLVGFNCRRFDNHLLYARAYVPSPTTGQLGYTNEDLYNLSKKIIGGSTNCFFEEAYNISYTDVYDFSSKKQSLKKFEIDLGLHHLELGLPWDKPVPEELWPKVAEYCDNDVIATEAVFDDRKADFIARQILADVAGMTVNDTTNSLTTRIIFGNNRKPQDQFCYRNMGEVTPETSGVLITSDTTLYDNTDDEFTRFDENGRPVFPGYKYDSGISMYRGEEVGEGGYVYAEPGMYGNVALLDVASMHPSSIVAENLFGTTYTKRFEELKQARVEIKHENYKSAETLLDGKLAKYIQKIVSGELASGDVSNALKIAINSVYGLTKAGFDTPFKDPRNKDNLVAKRGALFMINLKHAVQAKGFTVAHIKTDSIKIPDATPDIIDYISAYGKQYGYTFEHEATYDRMCLVNDAVYIAKYATPELCQRQYGYIPKDCKKHGGEWTATGTQFQIPYVFKTLFTHESIVFDDMCETKSVTSTLYLDMNEQLPEVSVYETVKKLRSSDPDKLSRSDKKLVEQYSDVSSEDLEKRIAEGHSYRFIGKVGRFCPIVNGCGGGVLLRESANKNGEISYASVAGSKGYRWLESEMVKTLDKNESIDRSYYNVMVDEAVKSISKYGDFEWFTSDDPYIPAHPSDDPPWDDSDPTPFDVR